MRIQRISEKNRAGKSGMIAKRMALLLVLLLASVTVFAACGSSSEEDETAQATETNAAQSDDSTDETADENEDADEDTIADVSEDSAASGEEAADSEEETATEEETTTEPETTTRTEEEVGVKTLTESSAVIDGYEVSLSLPLPDGWEEYELDGEIIYVSEDYPLSVPNISIYAAENDGSLSYTTKEIIEEVCEETFADMSFTMGEFENTTISGYDAVIYSYSIVTGETEITQYYVLVETDLTLFRITFTDSDDACADIYQTCIDGITIS